MLKGNRGEWSEIYTFLKVLSEGEIKPADGNLNILEDNPAIPVIRVIREEKNAPRVSYYFGNFVKAELDDGTVIANVGNIRLKSEALYLYNEIVASNHAKSTFAVPLTEQFMDELGVHSLKAPSKDKSDILLQIHDVHTGSDSVCGWSIKSELGNPPTLLNAGASTNFIFELKGCTQQLMMHANNIQTNAKLKDRISFLKQNCNFVFFRPMNKTFERNMRLVDSLFPKIMANALFRYYSGEAKTCARAIKNMECDDPIFLGPGMYEYKFKKFLCAVALGMTPAKEWDGRDDATGGYLVVRNDGELVAFHIYNRDMFEDYLLGSTKFETASTSRHNFGTVYEKHGSYYINLNLQIRFK